MEVYENCCLLLLSGLKTPALIKHINCPHQPHLAPPHTCLGAYLLCGAEAAIAGMEAAMGRHQPCSKLQWVWEGPTLRKELRTDIFNHNAEYVGRGLKSEICNFSVSFAASACLLIQKFMALFLCFLLLSNAVSHKELWSADPSDKTWPKEWSKMLNKVSSGMWEAVDYSLHDPRLCWVSGAVLSCDGGTCLKQ